MGSRWDILLAMAQIRRIGASTAQALAVVLAVLAITAVAEAQPPGNNGRTHIQGVRFDVHATLGWWWAFGAGFRVDIPIVPDGFIDSMDDEFAITFGGDAQFVNWSNGGCGGRGRYGCWGDWSVWPEVAAQWNFYLTPKWSIFPELGLAIGIHDCDRGPQNDVCVTAAPLVSFGARYHFAPPRVALLLRVSFPFGFQVGLNF